MKKSEKYAISQSVKEELDYLIMFVSGERAATARLLVDNISFMAGELAMLRADIEKNGSVMMVKNGNGIESLNANPSVKVYNSMMKIYGQTISQLRVILPKDIQAKSTLLDFINNGKPNE